MVFWGSIAEIRSRILIDEGIKDDSMIAYIYDSLITDTPTSIGSFCSADSDSKFEECEVSGTVDTAAPDREGREERKKLAITARR